MSDATHSVLLTAKLRLLLAPPVTGFAYAVLSYAVLLLAGLQRLSAPAQQHHSNSQGYQYLLLVYWVSVAEGLYISLVRRIAALTPIRRAMRGYA